MKRFENCTNYKYITYVHSSSAYVKDIAKS